MNARRPNLYRDYRKRHRLTVHLGVAAVKRQTRRRLSRALQFAGASLAVSLLVLGGFLFQTNVLNRSSSQQPPHATSQPVAVQTPAPETTTAAPVATTPEPQPVSQPKPIAQPKPVKPPFTTPIAIDGNDECRSDTLEALELIASEAPSHYAMVTQYVGVIKCVSQGSGMEAYASPPRYLAGDSTRNAGALWYAGTIVHDAGHSKLYHDYLAANPGQQVPYDEWGGQNSEAICLNLQYDALQQMDAPQATLEYIQYVITTNYWEIPYDQRWW